MLSVEEARARILSAFSPLQAEQIGLIDSLGRVLAQDVRSRRTQPPVAVSAMDGYAVRHQDIVAAPVVSIQPIQTEKGIEFPGARGSHGGLEKVCRSRCSQADKGYCV